MSADQINTSEGLIKESEECIFYFSSVVLPLRFLVISWELFNLKVGTKVASNGDL